ncbi:MAG: hypothetical protein SV375_13670 [Thermodesulfobacteriota bacterium]|nr:hypothetical protein [Thermodesulfobacteriota bacterium]
MADSDTLEGEVQDLNGDGLPNDLNDDVGGLAAYLVAEYGQFSFGAEYITALDDFLYSTLSAEYLHGEYDDNNQSGDGMIEGERDLFTLQLAIEF